MGIVGVTRAVIACQTPCEQNLCIANAGASYPWGSVRLGSIGNPVKT